MKKGFTLIELLAVIVILAIIALISTPMIIGLIDNARKETFKNNSYGIIDSVKTGFAQSIIGTDAATATKYNYTDGVESKAYGNIELKYNGKKPENGTIIISKTGETAVAFYENNLCASKSFGDTEITLEEKDEAECVPYTDYVESEGVNRPKLATGMIPVIWSTDHWVTTTESDVNWYSYTAGDKKWANTIQVINPSSYTTSGTTVVMTDVIAIWVWIPRYAYQIASGYHTVTAGVINVEFLMDNIDETSDGTPVISQTAQYSDADTQSNYITHPAFTFGNIELTGIWVAKFEASGTTAAINFKPDVASLRSNTLNNVFTAVRNMETDSRYGWTTSSGLQSDGTFTTDTNNIDTHLIRNVEWGAVAYLSNSQYGKNSEVFINPSSTYITGRGGNTVSQASTADTSGTASNTLYGYDGKQCNTKTGYVCTGTLQSIYGLASSTTGNTYGVYDMSGGSGEVMAAYVNTGHQDLVTYGGSLLNANWKYKDIYQVGTVDNSQNNYNAAINIKGDAIYETSTNTNFDANWYSDVAIFPETSAPVFARGNTRSNGSYAGIFAFSNGGAGEAASYFSFRATVLVDEDL